MKELHRDVLQGIGKTPLLALRNIVPENGSRVLLKLEALNPTGSMKDRMALAMIEAAESDGRLRPGGTVVEYTGGSTGVSLSLVGAIKGYPVNIVTLMCDTGMKYLSTDLYRAHTNSHPTD